MIANEKVIKMAPVPETLAKKLAVRHIKKFEKHCHRATVCIPKYPIVFRLKLKVINQSIKFIVRFAQEDNVGDASRTIRQRQTAHPCGVIRQAANRESKSGEVKIP
jgi:hypothetical protein